MSELTWRDAAEWMLEGIALTGEVRGMSWRQDEDGNVFTCAGGAIAYGYAVRYGLDFDVSRCCPVVDTGTYAHGRGRLHPPMIELMDLYYRTYRRDLQSDNDGFGRDYVAANVKELLNDALPD